jgi:peroxiredoxin
MSMSTKPGEIQLAVGRSLPDLTLPAAPSGAPVSVRRRGRDNTVLIALHAADCKGCLAYLSALAGAHETLRDWDGRVLPVLHGPLEAAEEIRAARGLPFPVIADAEGRLREGSGIQGGTFLIADQWGELFLVQAGGEDQHDYPAPAEVAEWLRFVAIQCPECQGEAR